MTPQQLRIANELAEASKSHGRNNRYLNNAKIKADMIATIAELQAERKSDPHKVWNYYPKPVKQQGIIGWYTMVGLLAGSVLALILWTAIRIYLRK